MNDYSSPIWEAKAHTLAKHQILKTYLNAWMPIMSKKFNKELLFVDGFAGPGVYENGEDGSPILAIKLVLEHTHDFPVPVNFWFIEDKEERYNILCDIISQLQNQISNCSKIQNIVTKRGDCETILNTVLDDYEAQKKQFGPALVFLDQFGYSDVSMDLIKRIMEKPSCEVFSYLNWKDMDRFIADQSKWGSINKAFGGEEWKKVQEFPTDQKPNYMLKTYKTALKSRAMSKYVLDFAMCDGNDRLLYWLFFCTNNLRGLEEMKKSMCKVDSTCGFRFSDKYNSSGRHLFRNEDVDVVAQDIFSKYQGKQCTVLQIKEFVLSDTRFCLFKSSLKMLEKDGKLEAVNPPAKRRAGTFAEDSMVVKFISSS